MSSVQIQPLCLPHLNGAGNQTRAVLSTLLYYDLFSFSPTPQELVRFAHREGLDGRFGEDDLTAESDWWSSRQGYWYLKGREQLIRRRAIMSRASEVKLKKARRIAKLLQLVPGVRFVGVTGSLSMESSLPEDDIDFLVITSRGRLWLTRALVLGALWTIGVKRADDGRSEHPDQVCANIFLSEDDLKIRDHNLFIAHEICQMLPLLGPNTYQAFLTANAWTSDFLPQWHPSPTNWVDRVPLRMSQSIAELATGGPLSRRLENELMQRQIARISEKHARGHNVGVKLSPTQLRFHPRDMSHRIVKAFNSRWSQVQSNGHEMSFIEREPQEQQESSHA